MGATSLMAGHWRPISSESCGVSVKIVPAPMVTPPLDAAPDWTISVLAPMLAIVFCKAALEP